MCLQHSAGTTETSYIKKCAYWHKTSVYRANHKQTWHTFSGCSPSLHTRPIRPADCQCWPFAECPKLSAFCSNIVWVSVYGRAVCKLIVLSSEGREKRTEQQDTLRLPQRWIYSSRWYGLWSRAVWYRGTNVREASSCFTFKISCRRWQCFPLNTPYLFAPLIMSVQ